MSQGSMHHVCLGDVLKSWQGLTSAAWKLKHKYGYGKPQALSDPPSQEGDVGASVVGVGGNEKTGIYIYGKGARSSLQVRIAVRIQ